nr:unnamed protein product [Spirometra erinaceieuropaei]
MTWHLHIFIFPLPPKFAAPLLTLVVHFGVLSTVTEGLPGLYELEDLNQIDFFEELSDEEYKLAVARICHHLQLQHLGGQVLNHKNSRIVPNNKTWDVLLFPSLVRVAVETPSKTARRFAFENPEEAARTARVSIHWPERRTIQEFLVDLGFTEHNDVLLVRELSSHKRPLGLVERQALDDFVASLCIPLADLLEHYYQAGYHLAEPKRPQTSPEPRVENYCTARRRLIPGAAERVNQSFCLIAVPSTVLRTEQDREKRSVLVRLERITSSHHQNPTDIRFRIDISAVDYNRWRLTDAWLQDRHFRSIKQIVRAFRTEKAFLKGHRFEHNGGDPPSMRLKPDFMPARLNSLASWDTNAAAKFRGSVIGKMVHCGPWSFHVTVHRDTGMRFFDIHFNSRLMVAEAGLEEIVTIYHGDNPLADRTVSLASVQGIGEMWSELSPGVDCPADAVYLSVPMVGDPANGPFTIRRGLCLFESDAATHGGSNRRFFGFSHTDDAHGYATGLHEPSLFVVGISTIANNQFRFVTIFYPAGGMALHVMPTTYVHFDAPMQGGQFAPDLFEAAPQTTNFLFYLDLDVVSERNVVEEITAGSTLDSSADMSIHRRLMRYEREERPPSTHRGGEAVRHTLVCGEEAREKRCLQVSSVVPTRGLFNKEHTQAFSWVRKSLWASRYHDEELRGSSIYNGVDLFEPVVDFSQFVSNNESLVNKDVVIWANLASVHIPSREDYPHTFLSGSGQRITIKPVNFFDHSPDTEVCRQVFTSSAKHWVSGFSMDSHSCSQH